MVSLRLGSSWTILSVRASGAGPRPKSLLAMFSFQVPLKLGRVCADAMPRTKVKNMNGNSLVWELRTKVLLLLFEYNLLIGLAHGAGKVPLNGHGLAVFRERPTILGGEFVSVE